MEFLNDPTFWVLVAFVGFVAAFARPIGGQAPERRHAQFCFDGQLDV